jgi:hypothetical protein
MKFLLKICQGVERVAQVVEHLPSKCEALNSNPITAPKNNNKNMSRNENAVI